MKKIIVTGVTGQDGSHMVDYLLKNTDHEVLGAVRRVSSGNQQNIRHLKDEKRFSLLDLDITDSQNTEGVISEHKPDYFINFAANSFVGNSWDMPVSHMETNCMAVLHQLEALRRHAPKCRYYNAGSSEEFGDVVFHPQTEEHPLRPRSVYGASKCSARHLVKSYRDSYDLYAIQGWLFNHEGVRRGEEFVTRKITKGVARILRDFETGKVITPLELGNLDAKRDWSDAEDFVDGVWKMLNQSCPKDYILSSNETHTIRRFVEEAFNFTGFHRSICRWEGEGLNEKYFHGKDCFVVVNPDLYRPADVELLLGDSTKAREELGWEPTCNFIQLVKKMVDRDVASAIYW